MKNYIIYFEFFGRKMKTTILAQSEEKAKDLLKDKIIFHKVDKKQNDSFNDVVDILDQMTDFLNKK